MRLHFLLLLLSSSTGVSLSDPSNSDPVRSSAGILLVVDHPNGEIEGRHRHLREEPETEARGLIEIEHEIPAMVERLEQKRNYYDLDRLHKKGVSSRALSKWLSKNKLKEDLAYELAEYKRVKKEIDVLGKAFLAPLE